MTDQERRDAIEFLILQKQYCPNEKAIDTALDALMQPPALIVRSDLVMRQDTVLELRADIMEQLKDGVVVLPSYLHATYVPKGVHIKYEWEAEK